MHRIHPAVLFFLAFATAGAARAQGPAEASTSATPLAPVTVQAHAHDREAGLGSVDGASLHDSPASVAVISRRQLDLRQPRSISDLAKTDASMGDDYAPVGYYQDTTIRGYILDLATGFRINDLSVAGAQRFALEDVQRVEVLKGLAGLQAGVIAPGGLIDFVTKRPADVHRVTVGTDSHGSRYAAADLGAWLTPNFGLRFNGAWEKTHSYVEHANGRRNFYALAADWKIGDRAVLRLDSDYQTSAQRSVSGYQLLGGTTVPAHASRTQMLGYEPWQLPVIIGSSNTSARLDVALSQRWKLRTAVGHSRSVINDNVAYAYGCYYTVACASSGTPGNFFAPDGSYDIYDYRSPDDTRDNDEAKVTLVGSFATGPLRHTLSLGVDQFRRTVSQRPYVYDYVGSANIDQRNPPYFPPSPNQPGPSARRLDSWQRSLLAQDRIHVGDHWQVLAGARMVHLDESAFDDAGFLQRRTRLQRTLPQAAVLWQPTDALTGYLSYGESLSLGQEAPWWASNGGAILSPLLSRQLELGAKMDLDDGPSLSAALFRIRQPYQYAMPDASPAGYTFVQQGQAVHQGLELAVHGPLGDDLHLDASMAWLRARASGTGTPAYEGHQVVNVPAWRSSVFAEYRLPALPRLSLLGGWRFSSAKSATPDGRTRVGAYSVFDAGLVYRTRMAGRALTWRLIVDNLTNRFYWRDTGTAYGDAFLFPGAPRLARLTATWDF